DDHHALARAGIHVDVVHAHARAPKDAQAPRVSEKLRGDGGGGARDDGLVIGEPPQQLLARQLARDLVDLKAALAEQGKPLGRDRVDPQPFKAVMLAGARGGPAPTRLAVAAEKGEKLPALGEAPPEYAAVAHHLAGQRDHLAGAEVETAVEE